MLSSYTMLANVFCMEPNYKSFIDHRLGKLELRSGLLKTWARVVEVCREEGPIFLENSRTGWPQAVAEEEGPTRASSSNKQTGNLKKEPE